MTSMGYAHRGNNYAVGLNSQLRDNKGLIVGINNLLFTKFRNPNQLISLVY